MPGSRVRINKQCLKEPTHLDNGEGDDKDGEPHSHGHDPQGALHCQGRDGRRVSGCDVVARARVAQPAACWADQTVQAWLAASRAAVAPLCHDACKPSCTPGRHGRSA